LPMVLPLRHDLPRPPVSFRSDHSLPVRSLPSSVLPRAWDEPPTWGYISAKSRRTTHVSEWRKQGRQTSLFTLSLLPRSVTRAPFAERRGFRFAHGEAAGRERHVRHGKPRGLIYPCNPSRRGRAKKELVRLDRLRCRRLWEASWNGGGRRLSRIPDHFRMTRLP